MENEIIYFELNNWCCGRDYPDAEPFMSWMRGFLPIFRNEKWVKENKLCVRASNVDMSQNFCISATKEWVEQNCPELLTKYTQFLRKPDKYGDVDGRFGCPFLEYEESNFGITWWYEDGEEPDESEDDEDDE